jgi:hypothetical protein
MALGYAQPMALGYAQPMALGYAQPMGLRRDGTIFKAFFLAVSFSSVL